MGVARVRSRRLVAAFVLGSALVAALFAGAASAQIHLQGYAGVDDAGVVYLVKFSGVTTVSTGRSGSYGITMSRDNGTLLVPHTDGTVVVIDPAAEVVLSTLTVVPGAAYKIETDHHGDYYFAGMRSIWRQDASGVTTITTSLNDYSYGGLAIDIDSGDLLVQSQSTPDPLQRVSRATGVITTIAAGANSRYGIAQHIPTGDVYLGSCCGDYAAGQNLFVLRRQVPFFAPWLTSAGRLVGTYSLRADRASARTQQMILGAFDPPQSSRGDGGIYAVNLATKAVTRIAGIDASLYGTEILYRRNVHITRAGTGRWDIGIHVPEDAGRAYVLSLSASGVRPGIPFGGGRRIALNPDVLMMTAMQYGLWPYMTGLRGTLDRQGRARAKLDLSAFGRHVAGVRLWFAALTLDLASPTGVRTVTDPVVFVAD